MLTLDIELLTGRFIATSYSDRRRAEWPPHPARVFSALVATCMESEPVDPAERAALAWLERQGPPEIAASPASERESATVFVPVNDSSVSREVEELGLEAVSVGVELSEAEAAVAAGQGDAKKLRKVLEQTGKRRQQLHGRLEAAMAPPETPTEEGLRAAQRALPDLRVRQPRTFPSVTPERSSFQLCWRGADPAEHQDALGKLAARVVRIGHSSSLVRCVVTRREPHVTWVPDPDGPEVLRVVGPGQLDRLDAEFERHQATEPRVLPCAFQRYRQAGESRYSLLDRPRSAFGKDWIVLKRQVGPKLPSTRAVEVASAVRGALMAHAEQPPRPVLSGHGQDGGPTEWPHVAIVPIPFCGSRHADGAILGVAVVLPRDLSSEDRRHVLRAIGTWERQQVAGEDHVMDIRLGAAGVVRVQRRDGDPLAPGSNLDPQTWCGPARRWISVTPMALDRNPGKLRSNDPDPTQRARTEAKAAAEAREVIAHACERTGLPRPSSVVVLPSVSLVGTAKAVQFPPFPEDPRKTRRVKVHAEIHFPCEVDGPVLLGAGRYLGLGLFRPVREDDHGVDR